MKKVIAIGLIAVMSAQCLYQLGLITYFQMNRDFISEVLCINKEKPMTACHGHCYLKRNLEKTESPEQAPVSKSGKEKLEIPVFLISENEFDSSKPALAHQYNLPGQKQSIAGYPSAPFHPPTVV